MKLLRGLQKFPVFKDGVIASIGNFDGLHVGHQRLISHLKSKSILNLPLVLILFEPQPREYLQKNEAPARLTSLREKLDMLKSLHIDYVYCIKFDKKLAKTSAIDFACGYLFSRLNVKTLLVGEDFRFGKNREGDVHLLKTLGLNYGCKLEIIPDVLMNDEKVSSTKIRQYLAQGQLKAAARYLGRPYSLCARVIYGSGLGRQWGIPTANLNIGQRILALQGVFVVEVHWNSKIFQAVANVGKKPTVDGRKNSLEVHLFDFDESIYGKRLKVIFLHKLRDEIKFAGVNDLVKQIHQDIAAAKAFFIGCPHD